MKKITLENGSEVTSVHEFNDGFSHFIVDDGCYVLVNGDKISSWIFPEALKILKELPEPAGY